jgi:hypothetical protein
VVTASAFFCLTEEFSTSLFFAAVGFLLRGGPRRLAFALSEFELLGELAGGWFSFSDIYCKNKVKVIINHQLQKL